MKPALHLNVLFIITLFIFAHPVNAYSQACNVSNLRIQVNNIISTGSSCQVNATISWVQQSNSANKFTNFHIWTSANYPGPLSAYSKPPSAVDLANSLGTFVINNPGSSTPGFNGSYPPASGVPLIASTASTVVSKTANTPSAGKDSFNVSNVLVTLSNTANCTSHFILKADIWSCQASNDQTVQCFTTNGTFATADVNIAGQISCVSPRKFQTTIATTSTGTVGFNYQVYADAAHTGTYDQSDPMIYSNSGTSTSGVPFGSGQINYSSYAYDNLIVVVQVTGNPISTFGLITNICPTPLPVSFVSFKAGRTEGSGVLLTWETAMEQNNKGFEVQRKAKGGSFEVIGFVPSKAANGASSLPLSYEYTDAQAGDGEAEYRLDQVDLDGQKEYSSVVMVKAIERPSLLSVYPNPSQDGTVTLSFANTSPKDILVSDASGRIIRTVQKVVSNYYTLSGLPGGMYILKVVDNSNNKIDINKVIIKK